MIEAGLHAAGRPLGLLAEVSHACPLHCPYCSNPPAVKGREQPLPADVWQRAIAEAAELGVLQCSFSGGEPLLFRDLDSLIAVARREGMYTNLITSGVGLTAERAEKLKAAGLDNAQISFQADTAERGDPIAGARVHALKREAARAVKEAGLNLSLNVVLNRYSIDRLPELADLAQELGANRIELAHVQFYGWAFENRTLLLPTREQMAVADAEVLAIRERCRGSVEVLYVKSDYYDARPKACMGGWGAKYLTIDPDGWVLPCPTARSIPGLQFENVRDASLKAIWERSDAFQRFRGNDWMQEPCRSCEFRTVDFGGCRCQAALLAEDAAATNPVCRLSPHRGEVDALLDQLEAPPITAALFRQAPSRELG